MTSIPTNPRRRRAGIAMAAVALVALVGSALAFAHQGGWRHGGPMGEANVEQHLEHVQAMLTKIGASDVQKKQIEAILEPALNELKVAHEAHGAAFAQFHEAMMAPSIDRAKLESLRADQIKALDEASKRLVTALSDAAEVLSPDQRAALGAEIAKHHGG